MRISDWSSDVCSSDLVQTKKPDQRGHSRLRLWRRRLSAGQMQCRIQRGARRISDRDQRADRTQIARSRAHLSRGFERGDRQFRAGQAVHRSEEHTSELQSLMRISYAVFCLKKKKKDITSKH